MCACPSFCCFFTLFWRQGTFSPPHLLRWSGKKSYEKKTGTHAYALQGAKIKPLIHFTWKTSTWGTHTYTQQREINALKIRICKHTIHTQNTVVIHTSVGTSSVYGEKVSYTITVEPPVNQTDDSDDGYMKWSIEVLVKDHRGSDSPSDKPTWHGQTWQSMTGGGGEGDFWKWRVHLIGCYQHLVGIWSKARVNSEAEALWNEMAKSTCFTCNWSTTHRL